ncbi:hypothetical protein CHH75_22590 [Paenibacillus sp. 7541]|uniref:Uncharacterized protein n=1 Tax=Paenibacillus campinasensis TaxID=66347 RepID=A0A268EYD9_9BACL|nr:hypothetical protein CHH67_07285 [Paenibacillus campinasensis]PAK48445.1 hypothetical protein CHH75_22590 [Paenibacillus sp. 7541]
MTESAHLSVDSGRCRTYIRDKIRKRKRDSPRRIVIYPGMLDINRITLQEDYVLMHWESFGA